MKSWAYQANKSIGVFADKNSDVVLSPSESEFTSFCKNSFKAYAEHVYKGLFSKKSISNNKSASPVARFNWCLEKGKVTINDMMEKFPYSKSWVGQLLNTLEVYQKCKTRRDWVSLVPHIKMDPEDQVRRGRPPVWAHPSIDTIDPEE